jgi:hypothetical protein
VSDTFDSDPDSLPPVTKQLRQCWIDHAPGGRIDAIASTFSMRAVLDAVHSLELAVIALQGS